ncbi:transcriptional regulator, TetR family [Streptoalloteichus tenebrarius]|uniref:Transcriptional regulator, TetR family n=1 Tax=Streptoalloteichus tenebrarius (strain ATCC 17920 / DSM 40477 / JCM 4838 / CBS 697.72 / NBRC 16177 / NCIMB 11028 / NRRL B-12390 / A12253. 1 / ISP 5477) TaxID=1933 RepID=A0ABT1I2J0_STRSD|nr:hypothetical protein [Streptoalloteichus tenebrarius]MCP2262003.1 transcriptional regulator, TetR family [Streptoalloteichus tenebrarius]BFF02124.1 hypothetical protein GCM10020241_37990 [Streptoalloteichus tenebrarius]
MNGGIGTQCVLRAALELVDEHGLDVLSMRRPGARRGVEGMSLYHHVLNRSALLDGLVEWVLHLSVPPGGGRGRLMV